MATPTTTGARSGAVNSGASRSGSPSHTAERRTTETKAAFKTTEFISYLTVLAGILIAALVVDNDGANGFGAQKAWLYATILTVGYMVARGLAKSGSSDPYTHRDDDRS